MSITLTFYFPLTMVQNTNKMHDIFKSGKHLKRQYPNKLKLTEGFIIFTTSYLSSLNFVSVICRCIPNPL